jgi:WD40 repeat protein/ankyrin repeat protein
VHVWKAPKDGVGGAGWERSDMFTATGEHSCLAEASVLLWGARRTQGGYTDGHTRGVTRAEMVHQTSSSRAGSDGGAGGDAYSGGAGVMVACSAGGAFLVSAGGFRVCVWSQRGELLRSGAHSRGVLGNDGEALIHSVALAAGGALFATGGDDGSLLVWDRESCAPITRAMHARHYIERPGWVTAVAISAAGTRVFSGGDDGRVCGWNARSGEQTGEVRHSEGGEVNAVACTADGLRVASGGQDGRVCLWDARTSTPLFASEHGGGWVNSVALSADGALMLSGGNDGRLLVFDGRSGARLSQHWHGTSAAAKARVKCVAFAGEHVASAGDDARACLWAVNAAGSTHAVAELGASHPLAGISATAAGTAIVTSGSGGRLQLWEPRHVAAEDAAAAAARLGPDARAWLRSTLLGLHTALPGGRTAEGDGGRALAVRGAGAEAGDPELLYFHRLAAPAGGGGGAAAADGGDDSSSGHYGCTEPETKAVLLNAAGEVCLVPARNDRPLIVLALRNAPPPSLCEQCHLGNVAGISSCLAAGASVEGEAAAAGAERRRVPLACAAQAGRATAVVALLAHGAATDGARGARALRVASDGEVKSLLREAGALGSLATEARDGNVAGIRKLLDGSLAPAAGVCLRRCVAPAAEPLITGEAAKAIETAEDGHTPLVYAAKGGHAEAVSELLRCGAEATGASGSEALRVARGEACKELLRAHGALGSLHVECRDGNVAGVQRLLSKPDCDLEATDARFCDAGAELTALAVASEKGRIETVQVLLEAGAEASGGSGSHALRRARDTAIASLLRVHGAVGSLLGECCVSNGAAVVRAERAMQLCPAEGSDELQRILQAYSGRS